MEKTRLLETVTALSKAFALAVPHEKTTQIRDDVAFFPGGAGRLGKTNRYGGSPV